MATTLSTRSSPLCPRTSAKTRSSGSRRISRRGSASSAAKASRCARGAAGTLDHAFMSSAFTSNIVFAEPWHVNADEPTIFDYNLEFTGAEYFAPDSIRASDHDPLCVVLDLQPSSDAGAAIDSTRTPSPRGLRSTSGRRSSSDSATTRTGRRTDDLDSSSPAGATTTRSARANATPP